MVVLQHFKDHHFKEKYFLFLPFRLIRSSFPGSLLAGPRIINPLFRNLICFDLLDAVQNSGHVPPMCLLQVPPLAQTHFMLEVIRDGIRTSLGQWNLIRDSYLWPTSGKDGETSGPLALLDRTNSSMFWN